MKPWQKGIEIERLKEVEGLFSSWNDYAQHELSKFKKNTIADPLSKQEILIEGKVAIHYKTSKRPTKIKMFPNVVIGTKQPGDIEIAHLGYDDKSKIIDILKEKFTDKDVWLLAHEENFDDKDIAEQSGFVKIGTKFSSVADIIGVYFRGSKRDMPSVPVYQKYTLKPFNLSFKKECDVLKEQLEKLDVDYTNHYSNYNKGKSWSAISLRGYRPDPNFITKPIEMNKKWKEENKDIHFEMQDTEMRKQFPIVEDILSKFETEIHRVRFMRLKPGGGELERHTDQVDPDIGIENGALMRVHVPIKTNPDVEFTSWTTTGSKTVVNMEHGSCWYLDIRKPHMAINNGDTERIHLVIDVEANEKIRTLLVS